MLAAAHCIPVCLAMMCSCERVWTRSLMTFVAQAKEGVHQTCSRLATRSTVIYGEHRVLSVVPGPLAWDGRAEVADLGNYFPQESSGPSSSQRAHWPIGNRKTGKVVADCRHVGQQWGESASDCTVSPLTVPEAVWESMKRWDYQARETWAGEP